MVIRNIIILTSIVLLLGCSTQKSTALRIGYNNWPGYEIIWLADALGYFKAQNLKVDHIQFVSLGDARRAYERGQLDAVGVTAIELIQIASHARYPAQAAMILDISHGADQVIAKTPIQLDSTIARKKFAIEPATVSVQLAALLMQRVGLNWQDVEWISMSPAEMVEAMQQSRIDLAATYAPFTQQMIANLKGNAHVLFTSEQVPNSIVDMLAINVEHRKTHLKEWRAFALAMSQAIDFLHQKPDEAATIIAAHSGLTVADVNNTLSGLIIPKLSNQVTLLAPEGSVDKSISATQVLMDGLGMLTTKSVISTDLITDQVLLP